MRIRTIKPEFWRSDDITALSREHRLLFIGLWSYVDDNGVGIDDHRQIAADLFALEEDQTEVRAWVREGLATLSRALLIFRYEVDGKRYLYIRTWKRHQRVDKPNKPRFPEPTPSTSENDSARESPAKPSREVRETPSTGTEEQRNRGTEEERTDTLAPLAAPARTRPEPDDRFAEFYATYPRHVDRRAAERAWKAARKRGVQTEHMIAAARRYAESTSGTDARYIKHPASWLNAGAYDDEPDRPAPLRRPESRVEGWQALKAAPQPERPVVIDAEIVSGPRRALP